VRSPAQNFGRMGGQPPKRPAPLYLDFSSASPGPATGLLGPLSFARASAANAQSGAAVMLVDGVSGTSIGTNVPRIVNFGTGAGLIVEKPAANLVALPRAFGSWPSAGAGVTTYTNNAVAGPDGQSFADRLQVASNAYARYQTIAVGAPPQWTTGSLWMRGAAGGEPYQMDIFHGVGNFDVAGTLLATWARYAWTQNMAGTGGFVPGDGRFEGNAGFPQALDFYADMGQAEASPYATTWAASTRAGERLYHPTGSALVRGGKLTIDITFIPEYASSVITAAKRLWTDAADATTYLEIDPASLKLKASVVGSAVLLGTAIPAWSAFDTLRIQAVVGNGAPSGFAVLNGGAQQSLGTGSAHAAIALAGALDIACSGTSSQLDAAIKRLRFL